MIGSISKKLLATIASWLTGAVSLLGFVFFNFPGSGILYPSCNNYSIMTIGFNVNNPAPATIVGISIFNLLILIVLIASIFITVLANVFSIKFRYFQTLSYLVISLFGFLLLIFTVPDSEYRFSLTMGITFFILACINGYFCYLQYKGKLKEEN